MKLCTAVMDGVTIADRVKRADGFLARLAGWMGKRQAEDAEGLLLSPCRQIHTFFMRFPIDVLYLSKTGEILKWEQSMPPGKIGPSVRGCASVLELVGGVGNGVGIRPGRIISFL